LISALADVRLLNKTHIICKMEPHLTSNLHRDMNRTSTENSTISREQAGAGGEPLRVAFTTLGCKLNQFETAAMQEQFKGGKFRIVPFEDEADIYVINTCTVTGKSDYRSRQAIRRAVKKNEKACVIATGCYSQVDPESVASIRGVDLVLGNTEKLRIMEYITKAANGSLQRVSVGDIGSFPEFQSTFIDEFPGYTRAFIKVQDGCDFSCAYCLVSTARGPNRSESPERVYQQAERLAGAGYRELVLTGIHLGTYGTDLGKENNLARLIRMLHKIDGIEKIRLSSIEPAEITDELIETIASLPKLCHHLHMPMQSGDEWILRRMKRNYDPRFYESLLWKLLRSMPNIGIGADVMVGFPGETEERFLNTKRLIEKLPLSYLHVFNFSPRKGTPAASFSHQVNGEIRKKRSEELRNLGKRKSALFREKHRDKEVEVLVESTRDKETGLLKGLTDNYIQVLMDGDDKLTNRFVRVRLAGLLNGGMLGEIRG